MKLPFNLASTRFNASTAVRLFNENGRRHLPAFAIAFVLLAIAAAATGASAYIMKDIINEIFVDRNQGVLYLIALMIAVIFTAKGLSSYFSLLILEKTGNSIVASIQNRIYHKLIHSRMAAYDRTDLGNLTTRFTHNASAVRRALNLMIVTFGRDALSLVSLVAVMVIQDPMLSAAFFLAGPPIIYLVMRIMKSIKGIVQSEFAAMAQIPSLVKETYIGVRVIKTFQLEDRFEQAMQAAVAQVQERMNAMVRLSTLTVPMMEVFAGLSIAGVVLMGGAQVVEGSREPGTFFSFLTALLLAYDPARRLARFHVDFGSAMVGVQMLYDFLDDDVDERDAPGATPLIVSAGEIRFEDVRFSYGEGDAVALKGVDLVAPARKVTALVGPSGAGKSTLFSLLTRLYDPNAGRILIDGAPISEASTTSVRGAISLVSQDNWLFEGTVAENIAYGAEGATEADILRAAGHARVTEFLDALPNGLDTQVGESGRNLSGGQRQRVSIARAFLRERPILLLDEATASLDSITEAAVKAAIDQLMKDRTTLVIAHRLSTVLHADQIVVMAEGRVAATGAHAELLENSPLYKAIFDAQFAEATRTTAAG